MEEGKIELNFKVKFILKVVGEEYKVHATTWKTK
jgi:hypothetical protein